MVPQPKNPLDGLTPFHRTILNSIPDLVWLKDSEGIYLGCNQTFERFFGAKEAQIIGKRDHDFVGAELADFFLQNDQKAMQAKAPMKNEEWLTFAGDGYHGLFETIKIPLFDENNTLCGVLGIARDITLHKKVETELQESQDRFKALHSASFGGIAIHDKGVILECNLGLADMSGFSEDELVGMDGLLLIAEQDRSTVMENILSDLETPYEVHGLRKNGEQYPVLLQARNVPYQGKQVRTVEFRDITQTKNAEADRAKLQNQLNQAQKMESVGMLAGGIAHDFNNLLQVILGYGDIVLDELGPAHAARSSLQQIIKAGHRGRTLVSQLLAFSRRQLLDMENVNLNNTIQDMLNMLERIIGEHIALTFHPGNNLGTTVADSNQIGQILTNLCINARDAMPQGGQITIETENVLLDELYRGTHPLAKPGRYVLLSVTDTGLGMDKKTQQQAFEPFFTTKDVGKGSGLGLSTVYGLVEQHDGFVHLYSEVDQGTSFKIYLPIVERRAVEIGNKIPRPLVGGTETILMAEDDEMVCQLSQSILESQGYKLLVARNGEEAIKLYEKHSDEIDMLLLDVIMPKVGGKAVHEHISQTRPNIPTLFASGYSLNAIHTNFIQDSNLAIIQKPAKREELLHKVREVLDGGNKTD